MTRPRNARSPAGPPDADTLLAGDPPLRRLREMVGARMEADPSHDPGHLLRVARWTVRLGLEAEVDPRLAVAAALLHDVVNLPKGHPERSLASERSASVAREVLPGLGFGAAAVEEVAAAIRDHSFSRGAVPESPLGEALQDADRLEALGALGVFRCVATGVQLGAEFFHPDDPWARERPLEDARYSLDHFFTKLLRLPATFRTAAGRAEAERRAAAMRALLRQLGEEIGAPYPGK